MLAESTELIEKLRPLGQEAIRQYQLQQVVGMWVCGITAGLCLLVSLGCLLAWKKDDNDCWIGAVYF